MLLFGYYVYIHCLVFPAFFKVSNLCSETIGNCLSSNLLNACQYIMLLVELLIVG